MPLPSPETVLALAVVAVALAAARWDVTGAARHAPPRFAVVALALAAARWDLRWLGWWERPLARLARRKNLAIAVAAVAPLLLRAVLLPLFLAPLPSAHDEFSFLLGADTLAHGRLANPQHPMWAHFESIHILVRPVYASAFPIAPAAALAVGQVLFGHPWMGVWLSAGVMCGAICWMLQGWLPPRWALLGALLIVLRIGVSSYWMNSYWGGCIAATGGALALGALPRMRCAPGWRTALTMAAGLAILANSRPVEGAFFGLAIAVMLLRGVALRRIVLPLALFLGLTGIFIGYYFARVTGKPWVAPYVLYRNSMTIAPHFVWQKPTAEPLYNNSVMRLFYVHREMANYLEARQSPLADLARKIGVYWRFYLGPLLTIPLLALWRERRARPLLLMAAIFALSLVGQVWHNAHYAAPATGLAILIVMLGMRRLRLWRRPFGLYVVRCLPTACAAMLLVQVVAGAEERSWRWPPPGNVERARVLRQLTASGGKHLVLVRYARAHDPGYEWVYNGADIDGSPVVWARELDRGGNVELLRYFAGRQVWLVEPDLPSPVLVPYRDAAPRPMPFVQLGAPGIAVLRDARDIGRRLREHGGDTPRSCDAWNFSFTAVTGVEGPEVLNGCFPGNDRAVPVSFEHWFEWLRMQR